MHRLARLILWGGDLLVLYASLFLALWIRYRAQFSEEILSAHLLPFSAVFLIWLLVFYLAGLYDLRILRNNFEFFRILAGGLALNALVAIVFFYVFQPFTIAPKTNLVLVIAIFGVLEFAWRRFFNQIASSFRPANQIILWGDGETTQELYAYLAENPQLGQQVKAWVRDVAALPLELRGWEELIRTHEANLIVVPRQLLKNSKLRGIFFEMISLEAEIQDLPSFYERVFRKVPLGEIDEEWFVEHVIRRARAYEEIKQVLEFMIALIVQAAVLPLEILIALLVKLTSRGPVIYQQIRTGQNGRPFVLYKFRTMREDAERAGPRWAELGDRRTTAAGRVLRWTHLDELPQLWNILKGDLAFVGPRPERPEFVKILRDQVPFYEMRNLVKPGLTGWAQIHYRADRTVADVREKMQYDLYYLKHRSVLVDMVILIKTLKVFFFPPK